MAASCGPGGSWWGIAARQGAPAGFSGKACFLEAKQDARAGAFRCSYKGQYLQERSPAVTLCVRPHKEKPYCAEIPTNSA